MALTGWLTHANSHSMILELLKVNLSGKKKRKEKEGRKEIKIKICDLLRIVSRYKKES